MPTLSAFTSLGVYGYPIPERSEATPGLFNQIFSGLSANIDTLNSNVSQFVNVVRAPINVLDYGADPLGVKDSTSAMQNAHNTGKLVYYPSGIYKFTTLSNLSSGGILGDGAGSTILYSTDTSQGQIITWTGRLPIGGPTSTGTTNIPSFTGFLMQGQSAKTVGAGIQVSPPAGEASYLHFENVVFNNLPIGIDFVAASLWKVIGCEFLAYTVAGCQIANTNSPDSGDAVITACVFNDPLNIASAVLHKSSGGLKVIGNKMLGGQYGYHLAFNAASNTGNLQIHGNSIEQMAGSAVSLGRTSGTATFKNILIAYNEFGVEQVAIATDTSGFLSQLNVTGNIINLNGGAGTISGVTATGVTDILVSANLFRGNGGTSTGVNLSACTNGRLGPNYYDNLVTNIALTNSPTIEQWDANYAAGTNSAQFGTPLWLGSGSAVAPVFAYSSESSLGWYRSAASTIALSYGTFMGSTISASTVLAGTGSVLNPSYAFTSDRSTGLYRVGAGQLSIVAGGVDHMYLFQGQNFVSQGDSATFPGWAWNAERPLGWYRSGASAVGLSYGQVQLPAGTAVQPPYAWSSESSLGYYRSAASTIALSYGTVDFTTGVISIGSLKIKAGANQSCGTAVLGSNGSVNVANTYVKTGDLIFLTDQSPGGTLGDLEVAGIRNSSGFTIQSTSVTDTSTVAWLVVRPG